MGLWAFFCWGIYKMHYPHHYFEISKEELGWLKGEEALPDVAYQLIGDGVNATVSQCSIQDGNYSSRICDTRQAKPCRNCRQPGQCYCLPTDFRLLGTYGDPMYKYVKVALRTAPNTSLIDYRGGISLSWTQRLTLFNNMTLEKLYSFNPQLSQAYEIFFQKVRALEGLWFGFAGQHGNDESENLLDKHIFLRHAHEYSRQMAGEEMALYLRADAIEVEEFYEYYSLMRMLESMGGLWTALASVMAGFTLICAKGYIRCKSRFS